MECGTTFHWNADNFVIYSNPQALSHLSNWLHIQGINLRSIVGEMLGQCSSTVFTYNALAICTNNLTNNCDNYL